MKELTEKQLRDRMRFLSDKMESIWKGLTPKLNEFNECKIEFNEIINELLDRGLIDEARSKESSREDS